MTNNMNANQKLSHFDGEEKQQVQRVARQSLRIVTAGVGLSRTNDFQILFHETVKMNYMLTKGVANQSISPKQLLIINDIFLDVALNLSLSVSGLQDIYEIIFEALNIANHALNIINIRYAFNMRRSAIAAKSLVNEVGRLSDWILFDLIAYCWNFGKPRCLSSLAVLLDSALRSGGTDDGIVEQFGVVATTAMFNAVARLASERSKKKSLKRTLPLIAYRGGYASSPVEVVNRMRWFLDIRAAVNETNSKPGTGKRFYLVETLVLDDEIILHLNRNRELMIKADPHRYFETVELDPEWLPSIHKEGANA